MLELGDRLSLAFQTPAAVLSARQRRMEDLHRALAIEGGVEPLVDDAHSPGPDLLEDPVASDVMAHERHCGSVSEVGAQAPGDADHLSVGVYPALFGGSGEGNRDDLVSAQADHVIPKTPFNEVEHVVAEARGKDAIGRGGAAAPL